MSKLTIKFKRPTCCVRETNNQPVQTMESQNQTAKTNVLAWYKHQKAWKEVIAAQEHSKAHINYILEEIENVKREGETIRKTIKEFENNIFKSLCKTKHPKKLSELCKAKSCCKIDLSNSIRLLKSLNRQLQEARIGYRNAKIEEHILTEDVKTLDTSYWQHRRNISYSAEKSRLERETTSRKNALKVREETISSVAHSITTHVLQLPDRYASMRQIREAKNARRSVDKYFVKTIRKARETKAIVVTEIQLRQRRQAENLAKLKNDLGDIKQNLVTKNKMKRIHDEEIALEKEEVKKLLLSQGANPYIAEYLLAIEEKQREIQRKMLVEEQKRLLDMQREYAIIEAAIAKEESERRKWNDYWSSKVKDKVKQERDSNMELYYDVQSPDGDVKGEVPQENGKIVEEFQEADEELAYETVPEQNRMSNNSSNKKKSTLVSESRGSRDSKKTDNSDETKLSFGHVRLSSTRKPMQLDYIRKQSLLINAGISSGDVRVVLMDSTDVFDFGYVPIGERNYVIVNIANISVDLVKLKMSVPNPYGPFTLCNAIKDIPSEHFYTLKFRYQPKERADVREPT